MTLTNHSLWLPLKGLLTHSLPIATKTKHPRASPPMASTATRLGSTVPAHGRQPSKAYPQNPTGSVSTSPSSQCHRVCPRFFAVLEAFGPKSALPLEPDALGPPGNSRRPILKGGFEPQIVFVKRAGRVDKEQMREEANPGGSKETAASSLAGREKKNALERFFKPLKSMSRHLQKKKCPRYNHGTGVILCSLCLVRYWLVVSLQHTTDKGKIMGLLPLLESPVGVRNLHNGALSSTRWALSKAESKGPQRQTLEEAQVDCTMPVTRVKDQRPKPIDFLF